MRLKLSCLAAVALALLPTSVLGRGKKIAFGRDVQLLAELGIEPNIGRYDHANLHSVISHSAMANVKDEYISIPIDHNNASAGTYRNRFWVSDEFYQAGKPIMVYDAGETDAAPVAQAHLTSSLSFFRSMLEEFNAMGIVWEHRYYGESTPYPVNYDTPPERYRYLTIKQALADLPYFAQNFSRQSYPDVDLTPEGTPWIMLGGSYAGFRAALTRIEYPDTIYAAWASSAPVQAQVNMTNYFDQVYRGMVANGWTNCTKDIRAGLEYIDEQLLNNATAASIMQLFLGPGAEVNSNEDFTAALVTMYGSFQSYGMDGGSASLGAFCEYMELDPNTNQTAGPDGLAPTYGNQFVAERWAAWPVLTDLINQNMDTNCRSRKTSLGQECDLSKPYGDPSAISWTWQYCTEWGFYQANNAGPHALLSRYQTLEYQQHICNRQFPSAIEKGLLPPQPLTDQTNEEFGGWTIRPSNTYTSGGEFDPWRTLSVFSTEDTAPQGIQISNQIPACGAKTNENVIFGYVLENSEHCFDFQMPPSAGKLSRALFTSALLQWLQCFGTGAETSTKS
ncbi:putative serine peptidase, family S28 [Aspergillus homomorphus CBS 101889]|uniref:Peptidase S28 n=1 Tax=Aspergillus homomorphus (strain CBS 101889) TaxID=1450537 RepID=A0A395I1Z7_ASPHC|nr:peptidase S28 [Aspergillus homomorphus CBS 101889]RAL13709.1 peptidase S28 [Aspergillus homomorphus CBS 101889]